jgi:hypothetical protein
MHGLQGLLLRERWLLQGLLLEASRGLLHWLLHWLLHRLLRDRRLVDVRLRLMGSSSPPSLDTRHPGEQYYDDDHEYTYCKQSKDQ